MKSVSILIPVLNEENILEKNTDVLMNYLSELKVNFEILICDNGSTDKTIEIGNKLEKKYPEKIRFFSIKEKGVVGYAFKKNVQEAKYNNLISVDMDLSTDIDFIKKSIKLFEEYDIIIGYKQVEKQERSFWRLTMSSSFIWLSRFFLSLPYHDYSMASKAFKKDVIEKYLSQVDRGSSYVYKLIFFAKRDGYKITEIPVSCFDKRKSKFNLFNEVSYRFRTLMNLFFGERVFKNL